MRSTMPRGAIVQRATQSMKSRKGGSERRPVEDGGDRLEIVAAGLARRPDHASRLARRRAACGRRFPARASSRRARDSCRRCRPRPARARRRRRPTAHRRGRVGPALSSRGDGNEKAGGNAAGLVRSASHRAVTGSGEFRRKRARSSTACNHRDRRWRSSRRRKALAQGRRPCVTRRTTVGWPTAACAPIICFPRLDGMSIGPFLGNNGFVMTFPLQNRSARRARGEELIPWPLPWPAAWRPRLRRCARRCGPTCRDGRASNRAWRV